MRTVTIVDTKRYARGRIKVTLDTGSAFYVSLATAVEAGISNGQTLSLNQLRRLKRADVIHRSLNSALRYLGPRPRSETEIKIRLSRYGFDVATIRQVVLALKQRGFVDDASFARFWRENRVTFKPRSRRLIELELKQKGVAPEIIAEAINGIDEELGAYHAAQRKKRALYGLDYPGFRKRLGAFLRRRGFDAELSNHTVNRVWQEDGNILPN
jgi:regulatory protein